MNNLTLLMNETQINLLAGCTQASLVTLVGYPFDLVKGRMQTGKYSSTMNCVSYTVRKEGLVSLYRGGTAPWLSHILKRPIQYPIAEWMKEETNGTSNLNKTMGTAISPLASNYVIGGVTGAIGPILGTPMQVVKMGMQTTSRGEYTTLKYVQHIFQSKGVAGFYRGFLPTMAKDSLFGASFLGHYYTLRDYFESNNVPIPKWCATFISGATAHCATWLILIPIDNIKSKVQKANETRSPMTILSNTLRTDGVRSLWRGVLPACMRTIPVSGIAMVGYEGIREYLRDL